MKRKSHKKSSPFNIHQERDKTEINVSKYFKFNTYKPLFKNIRIQSSILCQYT